MRHTRHIPVNQYPLWKNLVILGIIIVALIYALPNFFGQTLSLQISPREGLVTTETVTKIETTLQENKIPFQSVVQTSATNVNVAFSSAEDQQKAQSALNPILGSQYTVAMTMISKTPKWLSAIGAEPMNLGLDLRGGMYLMLEADTQSAVESRMNNTLDAINSALIENSVPVVSTAKASQRSNIDGQTVPSSYTSNGYVVLTFESPQALVQAVDYVKNDFMKLQNNQIVYTTVGGKNLLISFNSALIAQIKQEAISQVVTVMRNRINGLGVAEASVAQAGDSRVVIELPGLQDATRAKQILGGTSTASFYIVNAVTDRLAVEEQGLTVYDLTTDGVTRSYELQGRAVAGGAGIINASPSVDQQSGQPIVRVELSSDAASHFRQVTAQNIHNLMGVMVVDTTYEKAIVDGKEVNEIQRNERLINVATIQSALGANFQITGLSQRQANNLALMIRSGALQVPVHIAQEQQIGPTLGKENIDKGIISIIIALVLVVLFMAIYYHLFGLIANVALLLNLILIIAVMSIIPGATLTLPGIAGIVLNLGMSIDGNVLIFERIREEIRNGMPIQSAIYAGYERAFGTIVDSNLTTLIVAVILFVIGTGAVKGFAVTLMIGIVTSMFTAVTVSRAMTNMIYGKRRHLKKISIGI